MQEKREKRAVKTVVVSMVREYKLTEKECAVCGKTFLGTKKKRYCSRACQNKAYYERHRERLAAEQREAYRQQKATPKK